MCAMQPDKTTTHVVRQIETDRQTEKKKKTKKIFARTARSVAREFIPPLRHFEPATVKLNQVDL